MGIAAGTRACRDSRTLDREESEGDSAHQLNVSGLRDSAVPGAERGAGRIVIERNTIPERLPIAGEVVVVQDIKHLCPDLQIHVLLDRELLGDRQVDVFVSGATNRCDARTCTEIEAVEIRDGLEGCDVIHPLVYVDATPRLKQHVVGNDSWNALRLKLRWKTTNRLVPEVGRHAGGELHAGGEVPATDDVVEESGMVQPTFAAAKW